MSKKASEDYVDFRKKYCNFRTVKGINELADYWLISPAEVCNRLVCDGLVAELKKKREIEEYKKMK